MKLFLTLTAAMALMLTGCGSSADRSNTASNTDSTTQSNNTQSSPTTTNTAPPPSTTRTYNGTASVGDFLSLTIDATTRTISYTNVSNGDNGTATYTVGSDGIYTIDDPTGNLVAAYEVPEYALLIEAKRTGPDHSSPSLITAVTQRSVSLDTWRNHRYNYMQFRTSSGGMEIGTVSLDALGNTATSSYWPYGALGRGTAPIAFNNSAMAASGFQNSPTGTYVTYTDGLGGTNYVFGTANGVFAVDTPNGAILGFEKAASKSFDPGTMAGTYKAVYYQRKAASTGPGSVETGQTVVNHATVTVTSDAQLTAVDPQGNILLSAMLTPVADAPYLYDGTSGKLADPCYGMFTFRIMHGPQSVQDTFVTFINGTMLFALFSSDSDAGPGYDYLYGVGVQ